MDRAIDQLLHNTPKVAANVIDSLQSAIDRMGQGNLKVYTPRPDLNRIYDARYKSLARFLQ